MMGYKLKLLNVVKETDSAEKRDFLISQGYMLVDEPHAAVVSEKSVSGFETYKLPDLRRYAEENGIDISGLKTKKEIVDAIHAAEEEYDADDGGEPDPAG